MTDQDRLQDLAHIRGLMERSTRFLSLSGISGIAAGLIGLGGAFFLHRYLLSEAITLDLASPAVLTRSINTRHVIELGGIAMLVLVLAISAAAFFTWRRGRHTGQGLWDSSAKRLMIDLSIPLAAGGIFCLALLHHGLPSLIPATTLVFYGLALLNASGHTLDEIRWLGLSQLLLGLVAVFWPAAGLVIWASGFGILHIFYGGLMYLRHERTAVQGR